MYQTRGRPEYTCRACILRKSKSRHDRPPVRKFPTGQCGECGAELGDRKHYYCKECFNRRRQNRWKKRKIEAVEQLGGECMACGWKPQFLWEYAALDFHHRNPADKERALGGTALLLDNAGEELLKCDLLCARCHRIHHAKERGDTW